ncbi:hypothetical protein BJV77DRAFT_1008208, partial [Russula vinacea]
RPCSSFVSSPHPQGCHEMSLLQVVAPLASLCFFSALSIAQVSAPNCTSAAWQWTFNSLGQNPCTVTAYMMATCDGGITHCSVVPRKRVLLWPYGGADTYLCYCNTIAYSLFSACGACQGQEWNTCGIMFLDSAAYVSVISWSVWVTNCTKTLSPSFTDENNWDANKSHSPELGPSSISGSYPSHKLVYHPSLPRSSAASLISRTPPTASQTSSSASPTSSSASQTSSSASPTSPTQDRPLLHPRGQWFEKQNKPNTAAIAGGVIGSLVGSVVAITLAGAPPAVSLVEQPITRIYNPDDPTTFPGTKVVRTCGASLLKYPCHRTLDLETLNPTRRSCFPRRGYYQGHPVA